jgi:hypothetical protein
MPLSGTASLTGQGVTPIKREASNPQTAKSSNSSNAPPRTGSRSSNLSKTKTRAFSIGDDVQEALIRNF